MPEIATYDEKAKSNEEERVVAIGSNTDGEKVGLKESMGKRNLQMVKR